MKRMKLATVPLLAVFALSAIAQESPRQREGRYDEQIRKQATEELQKKDTFHGITVAVEDGIVNLSGKVGLYIDKVNAEKRVRKVKNVDGVRNHVMVEGKTVEDAELRATLADKLRYDRAGYGIVFNNLSVAVDNGAVTVGGKVRDYPDRDSAIAIVETTPGVKDVIDEINVLPTSQFDDDLRIGVARAIYRHPALSRYAMDPQKPIRIIVDNGHVTLYGVVDSPMDKQIAEMQAKSVPNVFSVDNNLVVANQKGK